MLTLIDAARCYARYTAAAMPPELLMLPMPLLMMLRATRSDDAISILRR